MNKCCRDVGGKYCGNCIKETKCPTCDQALKRAAARIPPAKAKKVYSLDEALGEIVCKGRSR